jgi:hypothetical protein
MTTPAGRLDDALATWAFEPSGGDWKDVLARSREPGWSDVLRRARSRRRLGGRMSRRVVVITATVLAIATPALGIVVVTHTLGRESSAPGPRLVAQLQGRGASGTLTISVPGVGLVQRGPARTRVPLLFVPIGRGDHAPGRLTLTWELRLQARGAAVESVRLFGRDGTRLTTLCAPCRSPQSGRATIRTGRSLPLFNADAYVDVRIGGGRTLRGNVRLRRGA